MSAASALGVPLTLCGRDALLVYNIDAALELETDCGRAALAALPDGGLPAADRFRAAIAIAKALANAGIRLKMAEGAPYERDFYESDIKAAITLDELRRLPEQVAEAIKKGMETFFTPAADAKKNAPPRG